jgi:polyphosphate kinase
MHRNLDARIEAITPIMEPELKKYMQFLLKVYLHDNQRRWELKADGTYKKIKKAKGEDAIDVHQILMHHTTYELSPIPRT